MKHYQAEIRRLNAYHDFDENGIDSIDNLVIESLYGSIFWCNIFILFSVANAEIFYGNDLSFVTMLDFFIEELPGLENELDQLIKLIM